MRDKIVIIAVILAVGCLIIAVISGKTVRDNSNALDVERYNRIMAEEKLEQTTQKAQSLESSLTSVQSQLQSLQTVLEQEKKTSGNLKKELEKVEKLKGVLEQELKNALVTSPQGSAAEAQQ